MKKNRYSFETVQLEGGLLVPDILEKILLGGFSSQSVKDYGFQGSLSDVVGYAFELSKLHYKQFKKQISNKADAEQSTLDFVRVFIRDALGFEAWDTDTISVNGRVYENIHFCPVPVVVASCKIPLDRADEKFAIQGSSRRKVTPFQFLQEFLNASSPEDNTWGLVTNGEQIRLLRRSSSLTRPCWIEFDLRRILQEERYPDFAALFRTLHSSRAREIWEQWRETGLEQGVRVREGLRTGVTEALLLLGAGFISNRNNETLRQNLRDGAVTVDGYFQQLLRLVYRFLFLFTVEERGLLHTPDASDDARRMYDEGYSMRRLRERCLKNATGDRHSDIWECVRIVFRGLASGEPRLGLPAVGGLFAAGQCPDIEDLALENSVFIKAVFHLRWSCIDGRVSPIDYRNMGTEELGAVYESLLEYVPQIDLERAAFDFLGYDEKIAGSARKTSGSYYTPDSLVQELLKSALLPVISEKTASFASAKKKAEAIGDIKIIDPACGSGHFLLGAARYMAEHLARERDPDGVVLPKNYRQALRDVISGCIYGVDINPLAVELCRMSLWLESFDPSQPLSFLDHHLVCGNSLLGILDDDTLRAGIPDEAFSVCSGDSKDICRELKKSNKTGRENIRDYQKRNTALFADLTEDRILSISKLIEQMPDATLSDISKKAGQYAHFLDSLKELPTYIMANMYMAAFLLPKTQENAHLVPTSHDIYWQMISSTQMRREDTLCLAERVCSENRVLHWQFTFPLVMKAGGFDCVVGNPPWERIKLQEQEFFAARHPEIANARNKAEREKKIKLLAEGRLGQNDDKSSLAGVERRLYASFVAEKHTAEASSVFAHVKNADGGRFPLTGVGDVNTYALFAELFTQLKSPVGRSGIIVPSGIATDDSTKRFFSTLVRKKDIVSLYSFENRLKLFPAVDSRTTFCLLTSGASESAEFAFFLQNTEQMDDEERVFTLRAEDFYLFNPNTLTCPVFRSKYDAELTRKIYRNVPILIRDGEPGEVNPWGVKFMTMFHMSNDSGLFLYEEKGDILPLYEAKMIHHFDHRWATYEGESVRDVTSAEKNDAKFEVTPRYWVDRDEVIKKLRNALGENAPLPKWLMGWRDITNATNERTVIASVLPLTGVGHKMPLMVFSGMDARMIAAFLSSFCSLALDYICRNKMGGTSLTYFIVKQLPVIPPERYTESNLSFIVPRVLELTYTSNSMRGWAEALGCTQAAPFPFAPERRALLRAELDAYYARLYGLTRTELRYILDPAAVMGEQCPSVTFPGLKSGEIKKYGEYRTERLVLEAWDRIWGDVDA